MFMNYFLHHFVHTAQQWNWTVVCNLWRMFFLWRALTLVFFQEVGTMPVSSDWLKRFDNGTDNSVESSFNIRLFIISGPEALWVLSDKRVDLTSLESIYNELRIGLCGSIITSGVLLLSSSNLVCSVKYVFKIFALSFSSVNSLGWNSVYLICRLYKCL